MTREHVLMALGALVLIAPWSGLPLSWLEWILPLIGLAVIGIAFTMRRRTPPAAPPPVPAEVHEPPSRSSHIAFS
jgi:hypothetical protein